jgi:hypothetical protein
VEWFGDMTTLIIVSEVQRENKWRGVEPWFKVLLCLCTVCENVEGSRDMAPLIFVRLYKVKTCVGEC